MLLLVTVARAALLPTTEARACEGGNEGLDGQVVPRPGGGLQSYTADYIAHHLKLASRSDTFFSDHAVAAVHRGPPGAERVEDLALAGGGEAQNRRQGHLVRSKSAPRRENEQWLATTRCEYAAGIPTVQDVKCCREQKGRYHL